MEIDIHINKIDELEKVLNVASEVFKPNEEEKQRYHNKEDWKQKIKNGGLLISASINDKIVGFTICYLKPDSFHIWNVGVLEDYRKLGVWKLMHNEIISYATKNNYKKITINTYKDQFPNMYNFLTTNRYKEYKVEDSKSFFEKDLSH